MLQIVFFDLHKKASRFEYAMNGLECFNRCSWLSFLQIFNVCGKRIFSSLIFKFFILLRDNLTVETQNRAIRDELAQKSRLKNQPFLFVSDLRVDSDTFELAHLILRVCSSYFESARMDCVDFSTLLELTLPTASQLGSICPKILMLLESTLLHQSRLDWSISEMYSAPVGSPSFKSARFIDFFESPLHATIESALHSFESARVLIVQKNKNRTQNTLFDSFG